MAPRSAATTTAAAAVPCDYCTHRAAVLICRADSAKLCLFCDHHVHSANALSQKHLRSQICDNCSSEPVSVRCATDNLMLCQDCDWDAHANCDSAHQRVHVEGFAGCPSAVELGKGWGFDDLEDGDVAVTSPGGGGGGGGGFEWGFDDAWMFRSAAMTLQDLMVPGVNVNVNVNDSARVDHIVDGFGAKRRDQMQQGASCGRRKNVIYRQLIELLKSSSGDEEDEGMENGGGDGLNGRFVCGGNDEVDGGGNGNDNGLEGKDFEQPWSLEQQQGPFTTLLMLPTQPERKEASDLVGDRNLKGQSTQAIFKL